MRPDRPEEPGCGAACGRAMASIAAAARRIEDWKSMIEYRYRTSVGHEKAIGVKDRKGRDRQI